MKKIKLLRPKKLVIKKKNYLLWPTLKTICIFFALYLMQYRFFFLNIVVTDSLILSNCYFSTVLLYVHLVGYFSINSCNRNDVLRTNLYLNRWTL